MPRFYEEQWTKRKPSGVQTKRSSPVALMPHAMVGNTGGWCREANRDLMVKQKMCGEKRGETDPSVEQG